MHLLHIIHDLKKAAGPTPFCVNVCNRIAQTGAEVSILLGVADAESKENFIQSKVRLTDQWADINAGHKPDLVHVHSLWTPLSHAGARYARANNIPYVISAHGMLAPWALKHKWFKKKVAWWIYQKRDLAGAAMIHVTAECEIKWLRDLGFTQPCVMAPLGSDIPKLVPEKAQKRNGIRTVLFVGRIYPVKGLMNLVRAWAEVRSSKVLKCESALVGETGDGGRRLEDGIESSSFPLWQLVIAGPDQAGHKAELVAEAIELGLSVADVSVNQLLRQPATPPSLPGIIFTGAVYGDEKDALYRMADLFVLPSFTENFGVVVTDALSYGIPVITTKGTPWQELLGSPASSKVLECESAQVGGSATANGAHKANKDNFRTLELSNFRTSRSGWWIDIGVDPLAEALREAMSLSDEERYVMGGNGRRLVENKYEWGLIAKDMKCAYGWLMSGGMKPACVRLV